MIVIVLIGLVAIVFLWPKEIINPFGKFRETSVLPLEKYDFDNLKLRGGKGSEIKILGQIQEIELRRKNEKRIYQNKFDTREISFESNGKKISGIINYFPADSWRSQAGRPVVIMLRGYAEREGYYPGSGTWRVADKLAEAGFATISLDFLGYGHSDQESTDMLEARFEKVVSVLDLIESVKMLPWVDKSRIGIWAHSNGGQIALSVLEITGERYPTIMWAPMTLPFPDSVLSTIDETSPVKEVIDEFERHYDARRYAFENYYEWIQAPILIQQGTADNQVKVEWQQSVVKKLAALGKKAELIIYNGADHNLKGPPAGGWEDAVKKNIIYYKQLFGK